MKKSSLFFILIILFLVIIKFTFNAYKEHIPQLISAFIENSQMKKKKNLIESYNKTEYHNLVLYFKDEDKQLVPATLEALELGKILNKEILGSYNTPYDIVLFPNKQVIEEFSGLEYAIGFNNPYQKMIGILPENKEGIINKVEPTIWLYNKNIIHEYTHFIFSQKLEEIKFPETEVPLWFSEGLADYVGSNGKNASHIDATIVPLKELKTTDQWNFYRTDPTYDVYLQSYFAIHYLISTYGVDIIENILLYSKELNSFDEGFQKATKININEIEKYYFSNTTL